MNLLIAVLILGFFISKLRSIRFEPWSITVEFWPNRHPKTLPIEDKLERFSL